MRIVTLPIVNGITEQVRKPPLIVTEVGEGKPNVTLALVGNIVHCHEQTVAMVVLPDEGQETVPGPVVLPGGHAFEQLPLSVANGRMMQHSEQPGVELFQLPVYGFDRGPAEMGGYLFLSPFELSLMEETQAS
jgi:hypothetical protein